MEIQIHKMKLPENSFQFSEFEMKNWREKQFVGLTNSPRIFHIIVCDGWTEKELMKLPNIFKDRLLFWNSIKQDDFTNVQIECLKHIQKKEREFQDEMEFFIWKTAVYTIGNNWKYFTDISNRIRSELEKRGNQWTRETEMQIEIESKRWKMEIELKEKRNKEIEKAKQKQKQKQSNVITSHPMMFNQKVKRVQNKIESVLKDMKEWKTQLETCAQEMNSMIDMESFELENEIMLY